VSSEYFIVVIENQEIGDLQQDFEEKKCKLKEDVIELNEDLQKLDRDYTDKLKIIQSKKEKAREKQQKVLSRYCRVWFNMSIDLILKCNILHVLLYIHKKNGVTGT
jgi:septal ring factor EnvC (AmiA/AmiB activator)